MTGNQKEEKTCLRPPEQSCCHDNCLWGIDCLFLMITVVFVWCVTMGAAGLTHLSLVACVVIPVLQTFCFPLPSCHQHFPLCPLCQRLNSQWNVFIFSLKEGFYHIFTNILVLPICLEDYVILCLHFHLGVKPINKSHFHWSLGGTLGGTLD